MQGTDEVLGSQSHHPTRSVGDSCEKPDDEWNKKRKARDEKSNRCEAEKPAALSECQPRKDKCQKKTRNSPRSPTACRIRAVSHGPLAQNQRWIARSRLAGGPPCGEERGAQSAGESESDLQRRDLDTVNAHERVERGYRLAHRSGQHGGEGTCQQDSKNGAEESADETLAKKKGGDLHLRGPTGSKDSNLVAPPNHGGGEAVVDQINADHHRDEAQGGEVELKRGEHPLGLAPSAGGRSDDGIWRGDEAKFFDERVEIERVFREQLNRGEASWHAEELLGPANIHGCQAGIGGHADIVGFQFKDRAESFRSATCQDAEGFRFFPCDSEHIRISEPLLEIRIASSASGEFEYTHV